MMMAKKFESFKSKTDSENLTEGKKLVAPFEKCSEKAWEMEKNGRKNATHIQRFRRAPAPALSGRPALHLRGRGIREFAPDRPKKNTHTRWNEIVPK